MIPTDSTFNTGNNALQKTPLYFLEIEELDVVFTTFTKYQLTPLLTGS